MRNPVISSGEMSSTDIPEWFYSEFGLRQDPRCLAHRARAQSLPGDERSADDWHG